MTSQQARAMAALVSGMTVPRAAKHAGVHSQSVRRWIRDDKEFSDELQQRLVEEIEHSSRVASSAATEAIEVLRKIMKGVGESGSTRVRAAATLLDVSGRFREQLGLVREVEKLEEQLNAIENQTVTKASFTP